jgi:hypothetical protein
MSENRDLVRQPITAIPRSRRGLEERIYLRFPAVLSLIRRAVWRLPTFAAAAGDDPSRGALGLRGA